MATPSSKLWEHDQSLGHRFVIGADEAGRGCWAGPIVGAAVAIDLELVEIEPLLKLNDSKKLSEKVRLELLAELERQRANGAIRISRCVVSNKRIDDPSFGLQKANLRVLQQPLMRVASGLDDSSILVDAFSVPGAHSIIKGDGTSAAIAAASIVAKTLRDQIMFAAAKRWPHYGFESNKGYGGAKVHRDGLDEYGPSTFHRHSYAPVRKAALAKQEQNGSAGASAPDTNSSAGGSGGFEFEW